MIAFAGNKQRTINRETLLRLIKLKMRIDDAKEEETFERLLEKQTILEGKKGRGKTLTSVGICWQLRERFNTPIIAVGTRMGLMDPFGPAIELTETQFRDVLGSVEVSDDEERNSEEVAAAFKSRGIDLEYAVIVFDEAYKIFNSRRPTEKTNVLFCDFLSQQRHYHCTTLLLTPDRDWLDKRALKQVDWNGRCFHNKWTHKCTVRLTGGLETLVITINGVDGRFHTPYYEMYDTYAKVGYSTRSLNI